MKHEAELATVVSRASQEQEQKHYLSCPDAAMGVVKEKVEFLGKKRLWNIFFLFNSHLRSQVSCCHPQGTALSLVCLICFDPVVQEKKKKKEMRVFAELRTSSVF